MPIKDSDAEAKAQSKRDAARAKEKAGAEDRALKSLISTHDGRRFLWWLLEVGKFGAQPFAGQDSITNFQCGELNVGQQVFARIVTTEPAGYFQMLKDQEDAARRERTIDAAGDTSGNLASDSAGSSAGDASPAYPPSD